MLKRHALKGTVIPLISVDEFEAKSGTDEEVLVIAFYMDDEDPAKDLDSFIERSPFDIIDVDVSPNPDENGNYLVFVEVKRQPGIGELFKELVTDIENVTDKMDWKVKSLGNEEIPIEEFDLESFVTPAEDVTSSEDTDVEEPEDIEETVLKNTNAKTIVTENNQIKLRGHNAELVLNKLCSGDSDKIVEDYQLVGKNIDILYSSPGLTALRILLGEDWEIMAIDGKLLITETRKNFSFLCELI